MYHRVEMKSHSVAWLARNAAPRMKVTTIQRRADLRLRHSTWLTAYCMLKLDETSTRVKMAPRMVSRWVPGGGQTPPGASARMVKKAANRPLKNISSEPSQIMTPTASMGGRS